MIGNREFLELKMNALIDKAVHKSFSLHCIERPFTREELQSLLREVVTIAIDLYREDFADGMRKTLATARLNASINKTAGIL